MQATVTRNGSSNGQPFVEVQIGTVCFAVPVTQELPLGTLVDIVTTVVEVLPTPESELLGKDVSVATPAPVVVEDSPLTVKEQKAADKAEAAADHKKGGK